MPKTSKVHNKKRSGQHHKQSKRYHNVYLPYLPALLLVIASLLISGIRPGIRPDNVLAYATEMSVSSLLNHTNQQRASNGAAALSVNSKLNQAAQAKANDMVSRDYWSHNTPDGQEPWVFINQAGYSYQKAGENLAYGFSTSAQTVTGWMNSASHKANMLDTNFTEVGFGYKNAENYQDSGNHTVVVAMYAKPQVASASTPVQPSAPAPEPTPAPATSQTPPPAQTPKPTQPTATVEQPPSEEPSEAETQSTLQSSGATNEETLATPLATSEQQITRVQAMTGGRLPWATFAVGIMGGTAVTAMFVNHGLRLRKLLREGQRFVMHHPALDATMISIILFAVTLSQHVGTIL